MRLGYAKGNTLSMDQRGQAEMIREMSLDKLYVDKPDENLALKQLVAYSRRGDIVVVIDIRDFSDTAGGFFNTLADLAKQGVSINCSAQGIDTSTFEWAAIMKVLRIYGEEKSVVEKETRWKVDLDAYFDLVDKKEITVEEVCRRMNIGKTTY